MKDGIKPLEAPAVAYINTSMAVQMHDFLLVKVSATKNAGVVKRKQESSKERSTRTFTCGKVRKSTAR